MAPSSFADYIKAQSELPAKKPKEAPKIPRWVVYIQNRIKKNKNFLGFVSGPTGIGKSYNALSICEQVDPTFCKERIVTSIRGLLKLINSGTLTTGSAIIWDEFGVAANSRAWQSIDNKIINFLLQTFRHRCFILLFTAPYFDFVDSAAQKLFHAEFICKGINYTEQTGQVKPFLLQYNSHKKKTYRKFLRFRSERGIGKLKLWNVKIPSEKLRKEYEEIKNSFTIDLNKELQRDLDNLENKKNAKQDKYEAEERILTEKQLKIVTSYQKYKNVARVAADCGTTTDNVYRHLAAVKKKGVILSKLNPDDKKEEADPQDSPVMY